MPSSARSACFDVSVLGAGPAGSVVALTLARAGRRVALVDRAQRRPVCVGEALPPAARPLLHSLGILEPFLAGPHLPCYSNLSAWGSNELQSTDFLRDPNGHGWHLDRAVFDVLLRDQARAAGAVLYSASKVGRIKRLADRTWRLMGTMLPEVGEVSRGEITSRWLVDCTGRASGQARSLGMKRLRLDRLVGYVAHLRPPQGTITNGTPTEDAERLTLIEAAPNGWWYTAAVPGGSRVVTYLTDAGEQTGKTAATVAGFTEILGETQHVRERLRAGNYALSSRPQAVAAHTARLDCSIGEGWLAAGDASLSFDPLSSQGLFHALASGLSAGRALEEELSGSEDALARYAAECASVFQAYLEHRAAFYGQERRWLGNRFWEQRRSPGMEVWGKRNGDQLGSLPPDHGQSGESLPTFQPPQP